MIWKKQIIIRNYFSKNQIYNFMANSMKACMGGDFCIFLITLDRIDLEIVSTIITYITN